MSYIEINAAVLPVEITTPVVLLDAFFSFHSRKHLSPAAKNKITSCEKAPNYHNRGPDGGKNTSRFESSGNFSEKMPKLSHWEKKEEKEKHMMARKAIKISWINLDRLFSEPNLLLLSCSFPINRVN